MSGRIHRRMGRDMLMDHLEKSVDAISCLCVSPSLAVLELIV